MDILSWIVFPLLALAVAYAPSRIEPMITLAWSAVTSLIGGAVFVASSGDSFIGGAVLALAFIAACGALIKAARTSSTDARTQGRLARRS